MRYILFIFAIILLSISMGCLGFLTGGDDLRVSILGKYGSAEGELNRPCGIDYAITLAIADKGNHRVALFREGGGGWYFLRNIGRFGYDDSLLNGPIDVALDIRSMDSENTSQGNIYILNSDGKISRFTLGGKYILSWGNQGTNDYDTWKPRALACDAFNNIYITDVLNNSVQKFDSMGTLLTSWGRPGNGSSEFDGPTGIGIDKKLSEPGEIVGVTDSGNNRIILFGLDGQYLNEIDLEGVYHILPITGYSRSENRNGIINNEYCGFVGIKDNGEVYYDKIYCNDGSRRLLTPSGIDIGGLSIVIVADSSLHVVKFYYF